MRKLLQKFIKQVLEDEPTNNDSHNNNCNSNNAAKSDKDIQRNISARLKNIINMVFVILIAGQVVGFLIGKGSLVIASILLLVCLVIFFRIEFLIKEVKRENNFIGE